MNKKNIVFLFLFIFIREIVLKMSIYEWRTEVFASRSRSGMLDLESAVYELLKNKPLDTNVFYFAFPWSYFINLKEMDRIESLDVFLPEIVFLNGFTVCQSIHYRTVIPSMKKLGLQVLFTPHARKNEVIDGIVILPLPHYPIMGTDPAEKKTIYCSFIGTLETHPLRQVLIDDLMQKKSDKYYIKVREYWHFTRNFLLPDCNPKIEQQQFEQEYKDVLSKSRFSLCPLGTGPSTIRFWESLQAGAIPVVLSDEMIYLPGFDWDKCVVKIEEMDVFLVDEIISKISFEQELKMRKACYQAYSFFCNKNFDRMIRLYYEK